MGETIIDGTGSGFSAKVNSDNELLVSANVTVGSVTANSGSESFIFGKSGADYYPLLSTSGTDGGVLRVDSSVSVTTGSEVYIKAGSVQTYDPIGVGSVLITNGSIETFGAAVTVGSNVWVKGGSILNYSGTNYIDIANFGDVGSQRTISAGSLIILGSVNTYGVADAGSEVYIKAGSVQTYNPVGVGSVHLVNPATISAGSVIITGSVNTYGASVSTGSEVYIKAGSVQTYDPVGVGSIRIAEQGVDLAVDINNPSTIGSYTTQQVSGNVAVSNFGDLGSTRVIDSPATIGSYTTQTIDGDVGIIGSVETFGASVTVGSESFNFIKSGTGWISDPQYRNVVISGTPPVGATFTGSLEVFQTTNSDMQVQAIQEGTWNISNLTTGSVRIVSQADTSRTVSNFGDLGSNRTGSFAVTNFGVLGSTRVIANPSTIGSYTNQTVNHIGSLEVYQGTSTDMQVRVVTMPAVTQGTDPWIILGSVHQVNSSVTGSEVWIKGGSIHLYSGTSFINIGGSVQNFETPRADFAQNTTSIITTNLTSILSAAGAGSFHDLTNLDITNERSITSLIDIFDESGTSVNPVLRYSIAPKGGAINSWDGFQQGGAGSDWYAMVSGTAGSIHVNVQARKRI